MNIITLIDSFKSSLSTSQATSIITEIFHTDLLNLFAYSISDGGEGFIDAMSQAIGIPPRTHPITGPLQQTISAQYLYDPELKTVILESAQGVGIQLIPPELLDPHRVNSYGVGEQLRFVLETHFDDDIDTIILGLGGTASVDCGMGFLQGLLQYDLKFLNSSGLPVSYNGNLHEISAMTLPTPQHDNYTPVKSDWDLLQKLFKCRKIILASDVTNPLLGQSGAVYVFGPQKGVKVTELESFEAGFISFSTLLQNFTHSPQSLQSAPGAGAAGGIGFALSSLHYYMAHFSSNNTQSIADVVYQSGFELLLERTTVHTVLNNQKEQQNSLIITGEGSFDLQSLDGKVISRVYALSQQYGNIPIVVVCGSNYFNDSNEDDGEQEANCSTLLQEKYPNIKLIININDFASQYGLSLQEKLKNGQKNFKIVMETIYKTLLETKDMNQFIHKMCERNNEKKKH